MGIRQNAKRVDAFQKVTGEAKYVEDLIPRDALYVKIVHSTIANGFVRNIDTSEAEKAPGVEMILTCFDVPKHCYITAGHPLSLDPAHEDVKDKHILTSHVRYFGDDIAAVVADTPLHAQLAAELVRVEYEEHKPLLTPGDAINAPDVLHDIRPNNELSRMDFTITDGKPVFGSAEFSTAPEIAGRADLVGEQFHTPPVNAVHLENHSCFAYMDGRKIVVYTCNQAPHTVRRNTANALGIPVGDVRVVKPYLGGGFGNKQDTVYEPLVALLTQRLGGRCVAHICTREETFINTRTRHAFDMNIVSQPDKDGKLLKKAVRINSNGGSYAAHGHAITAFAVTTCFQTYVARDEQIGESSCAYTNLPTAAAMRGYGIPQIVYAMECQMDDVAREHGWDPIEFRRKNMHREGFVDPFSGFVVKSFGLDDCIQKGCELSNWTQKRAEYDTFNKTSKDLKKGLGMGLFAYKISVWPLSIENAACRIIMNEDGTAQIHSGAIELGQGADTAWAQIASEVLTIPENRLTVISTQDTDIAPYDNGAYASRQTYVCGGAVRKAAEQMRDKLLDRASKLKNVPADDLCLDREKIVMKSTGAIVATIADICAHYNFFNDGFTDTEHLTSEATYTLHDASFAYGVSFVDLEVDVPLGKVNLKKVWAVHDSGTLINPQLAEAQVHGGLVMGLGYALSEQMLFDPKTGKPLNNNLLDYKIPTAMDVPEIEVHFIETYEPSGPFGNKGLAEPPILAQAPAVRNAILHAPGVPLYEIPMTPQRLVHAFRAAGLIED